MEVLIDNKNGIVWDMPVSNVEWKTNRVGKVGTLDVTFVISEPLKHPIENGSIIRVKDGKVGVFFGYVFEVSFGDDDTVKVKAYDQLKYLMFNDTYVFPAMTATKLITRVVTDAKLKVGKFEDTKYVAPALIEDDKKALDVVMKSIDSTLIATNRNYVFYDDFGSLMLKNIDNMKISADVFYIGEKSLMYGFDYKKSIDKETYNRVKLVHDNKTTKKREVYIVQDSKNIAKWGRLQEFRKVDENMTSAQIKDLADKMIKLRNRETKSLSLDCLGHWAVRGGSFVMIYIEKLGVKEYFLVNECTHNWDGGIHTMNLEVAVI
ncbi:XkdQ/YqbQ family protein [Sporosarcina sp. CAU 1771]